MTRETLDRLLMDESLGALNEDVQALLDEFVQDDAHAQTRREDLRRTIVITRDAMNNADAVSPPPFPREALMEVEESAHRRLFALPGLRLAAAFVVGMGLTFAVLTLNPTTPLDPIEPTQLTSVEPASVNPAVRWIAPDRMPILSGQSL